MKRYALLPLLSVALLASAARAADEGQPLSLVEAKPFGASLITTTGHVQPIVCAKIGARVSGTIAEFGKSADGHMLDAGMTVKEGDVLFKLDDTVFQNTVHVAQAALASAKASLANLTARTRPERMEQLCGAVAELDVRLADRERDEARYRRLVEEEQTLPAKRLEEVQTEILVLKAGRRMAQARLDEANNGPTATEIAVAEAKVKEVEASLKAAQDDLRDSTVRAPFDGLIVHRFKGPGDYCTGTPHTDVLELMSLDKLEAELSLPETYFKLVQAGKTMTTLRSTILEKEWKLPVGRVVPSIDVATGTFSIRVPIPAQDRDGIAPGAFITAEIQLSGQPLGVVVPARALVEKDGSAAVFVAREGRMVRRAVEVGDRMTESVIIKKGLTRGERVVVGPASLLKDGAPLPDTLTKQP